MVIEVSHLNRDPFSSRSPLIIEHLITNTIPKLSLKLYVLYYVVYIQTGFIVYFVQKAVDYDGINIPVFSKLHFKKLDKQVIRSCIFRAVPDAEMFKSFQPL